MKVTKLINLNLFNPPIHPFPNHIAVAAMLSDARRLQTAKFTNIDRMCTKYYKKNIKRKTGNVFTISELQICTGLLWKKAMKKSFEDISNFVIDGIRD